MTPASNPGWGGPRKAKRPGKRMGRPPLHPNGVRRFYVNLSPADLAWLDSQPETTRAEVVRRLIDDARTGHWRPIETAPADGRSLLLWSPDIHPTTGRWHDGQWQTLTGFFAGDPTHWTPLPAAPEDT